MTEELRDHVCLGHQLLLLPAGDNASGDPVAAENWHAGVRTCNGAGDAEGPGRAVSTTSARSRQQEVGRAPRVGPGGCHMPDMRSAFFPAKPSQKDEKLLPSRYFSEQKKVSGHGGAEQGGRRKARNNRGKHHHGETQIRTPPVFSYCSKKHH